MHGPSTNTTPTDLPKTIPPANNNNHSLAGENINLLSLEQVELEILLAMKIEDGVSFEKAVKSAMICSGNEFLFSFPPERFSISCSAVCCIRLIEESSNADPHLYLYQATDGAKIQVAEPGELEEEFHDFAASFVGVMEQLRELTPVVSN